VPEDAPEDIFLDIPSEPAIQDPPVSHVSDVPLVNPRNPRTGDRHMVLYAVMLLIGGIGLLGIVYKKKIRQK
jgi:LPXTG-motif cell wall-anchored protein